MKKVNQLTPLKIMKKEKFVQMTTKNLREFEYNRMVRI